VKQEDAVQRLQAAFRGSLPGHDDLLRMSGYPRPDHEAVRRMRPAPRESAVLALIYPRHREAHVLLMLRPEYDGVHSGQVGFPGGRREPDDADLRHTAVREFHEETGAATAQLQHLGCLTPVYIPPSNSLVTPFVATVDELGALSPDPREVAALIEAPLALLLHDDTLRMGERHVHVMGRSMQVPYFDVKGHMVWGATALMIAELRALLSDRSPAGTGH
jgi:8-oxo-dGTP pyrophosphatase MutT (NUDIX family)